MGKVVGVIVALIGLVILGAGIAAIMKPVASTEYYAYRKYSQENPLLSKITEKFTSGNPCESDAVAQVGSYVVEVNHSIGAFDVEEANSLDEAKSIAQKAGLATAGVGVVILIIGGAIASSGKKIVIVEKSEGIGRRSQCLKESYFLR